jgi:flagellar biosynthesis/type III secretory pathway M-ring protein FliF/YscJ
MRGRIASFAVGAAVAKRRTASAMEEKAQMQQTQQQAQEQAQQQQREIQQLKAAQAQQTQETQRPQSSNQEDLTEKLQKYADLHQKGLLTDEEFQKLKAALIAKL